MLRHLTTLALVMVAIAGIAVSAPALVFATYSDYTPGSGPYSHVVGPNGTYLIEDSTSIDPSDIESFWQSATGFSRVLVPSGSIGCGVYDGCVLIDSESTTLNWVPSCDLPVVAYEAAIYIDTDSEYNLPDGDCHGTGSDSHPVFVLVLDSSANHFTFIGRHEVGHALGLPDTSTTCDYSGGIYYPLMNNGTFGTCSGYGSNYNASYNEAQAVISRNSWH